MNINVCRVAGNRPALPHFPLPGSVRLCENPATFCLPRDSNGDARGEHANRREGVPRLANTLMMIACPALL